MPTTPPRTFRPDPLLWKAVRETTARRGETASAVIVEALERYVHRHAIKQESA